MTAARRGPMLWARISAGIAVRITVPQRGQVRACPWCSVIFAAIGGLTSDPEHRFEGIAYWPQFLVSRSIRTSRRGTQNMLTPIPCHALRLVFLS